MRIYNITMGQLVILWIMGIIGTIASFIVAGNPVADPFYNSLGLLCLVMIPLVLIFYTIGWHAEWESDVWRYMTNMRNKFRHYGKYKDEEGKDGSETEDEKQ